MTSTGCRTPHPLGTLCGGGGRQPGGQPDSERPADVRWIWTSAQDDRQRSRACSVRECVAS